MTLRLDVTDRDTIVADFLFAQPGSIMRTYRTTGALDRILAFDGLSYETVVGSVDIQDLLGFGQSVPH